MEADTLGLAPSPKLRRRLESAWPPRRPERADGYRPLDVDGLRLLDAAWLGPRGAVAVVGDGAGGHAALPLVVENAGSRVAGPGDGLSARLVGSLGHGGAAGGAFTLTSLGTVDELLDMERSLGTDQTNTSVVVDDRVIVKWRTSFASDGRRALRLRRHLAAVGFEAMAPLLGALTWTSADGETVVLADVDGYLPGAVDGWDASIAEVTATVDGSATPGQGLAASLGALTADLHAALATASPDISEPVGQANGSEVQGWLETGLGHLEGALAIDADDAELVRAAADSLRADIGALDGIRRAPTQPIHGDFHVGQVLRWVDGFAVIDFDGAPGQPGSDAMPERQPAARDVAHLLCSLDLLAIVVDRRTQGRHTDALRGWAVDARSAFLEAYRERAAQVKPGSVLDQRLLRPFIAEQLCRELVYAAEVLPRWRYAPIGALRWRYLEDGP